MANKEVPKGSVTATIVIDQGVWRATKAAADLLSEPLADFLTDAIRNHFEACNLPMTAFAFGVAE